MLSTHPGLLASYALLTLIAIQAVFSARFWWAIKLRKKVAAPTVLPRTGVILSLRGSDAYLTEALHGLLRQDHPDYFVQIVVDSKEDPAWKTAQRVVEELGVDNVNLGELRTRRSTCSLKCSSLIQAVNDLDPACEVVAFMDADVIPHPTWLRELVSPLTDPAIGCTTGNRWYLPGKNNWGSAVRSAWNAAAMISMYTFKITWGGTLALRRKTLEASPLMERWSRSFNDDIIVGDLIREMGLRMQFVPTLIMVNREEVTLASCLPWVARQMVHARFYQANWPLVASFSLFSAIMPFLCALIGLGYLIVGDLVGWVCLATAVLHSISLDLLWSHNSRFVCQLMGQTYDSNWKMGTRVLHATLGANLMFAAALVSAMTSNTVRWRGITYRIRSRWNVEMVEYLPYSTTAPTEASISH